MIFTENLSTKTMLKIFSMQPIKKRSIGYVIGNKSHSLLNLFRLGYNVPNSIFLDYSFFNNFLESQELSSELVERLVNLNISSSLAIRSSSNVEDSHNESYAGTFKTALNVPNRCNDIKRAIIECYQSFINLKNKERASLDLLNDDHFQKNKM